MSDLISRQQAIEAVEFGITYAKAINKETGEVIALFEESNAELQEAADRIKQLPPAQLAPDQNGDLWITVPDIDKVTCIYVQESKSKFCRIFYEER